jgi:hypothetical protein
MPTSVFVGSSSEGLEVAQAIQYQLQFEAEVTVWNEGLFGLTSGTLETLVNSIDRFDFAILVLTPDDLLFTRKNLTQCPRDNIMFELGLFMGRLGRSRTFIVCSDHENLKLPSDLAGVTITKFRTREDKNIIAAVGPCCLLIRNVIKDLGAFEGKSATQLQKATIQVENISDLVNQLIKLMARSRVVELDIISKQFGLFISNDLLEKIRRDLKDLDELTKEVKTEKIVTPPS